jgi:hypothetical protein
VVDDVFTRNEREQWQLFTPVERVAALRAAFQNSNWNWNLAATWPSSASGRSPHARAPAHERRAVRLRVEEVEKVCGELRGVALLDKVVVDTHRHRAEVLVARAAIVIRNDHVVSGEELGLLRQEDAALKHNPEIVCFLAAGCVRVPPDGRRERVPSISFQAQVDRYSGISRTQVIAPRWVSVDGICGRDIAV